MKTATAGQSDWPRATLLSALTARRRWSIGSQATLGHRLPRGAAKFQAGGLHMKRHIPVVVGLLLGFSFLSPRVASAGPCLPDSLQGYVNLATPCSLGGADFDVDLQPIRAITTTSARMAPS